VLGWKHTVSHETGRFHREAGHETRLEFDDGIGVIGVLVAPIWRATLAISYRVEGRAKKRYLRDEGPVEADADISNATVAMADEVDVVAALGDVKSSIP